jgi:hypothetical protein
VGSSLDKRKIAAILAADVDCISSTHGQCDLRTRERFLERGGFQAIRKRRKTDFARNAKKLRR